MTSGWRGVNFEDRRTHRTRQLDRTSGRSDDQRRVQIRVSENLIGILRVGDEHLGVRAGFKRLLDVANDADDFHGREIGRRFGAQLNSLAERVAIREILTRHRFVDDDDSGRAIPIVIREHTSAMKRHTERRKIVRCDGSIARHHVVIWPFRRVGGAVEMNCRSGAGHRQHGRHRRILDARQRSHASDEFLHDSRATHIVVVFQRRERQVHDQQVASIESGWNVCQPGEAAPAGARPRSTEREPDQSRARQARVQLPLPRAARSAPTLLVQRGADRIRVA